MSTQAVVTIVAIVVIVLLAAAVAVATRKRRSTQLREEFGPEYDRTVGDAGKRRDAEKDLAARKDEYAELDLRPLTPAARERYTSSWTQVQAKFVDAPALAVSEADTLVTQLMADRGYPTEDFDVQARLLSVEHAHVLESYRSAHGVELASRARQATTEDIRNAMLDFRRVFEDVMAESDNTSGGSGSDTRNSTGDSEPYPVEPTDRETESESRLRP
ncbi:MAG: hypothetical protein QOD70_136 [Frankiales bacterium]|jgi:hypothetical protein|nr:hypothetical protein [Frankiales bacterium]